MNSDSKISIIIPAYNTANVILRTLDSIEKQTYFNYEIVIINDGSIDDTHMVLENYKKNNNHVIVHHQNNQGVSAARNKGIELATGDFMCFLDSDDTYDPTFLKKMIIRQHETNANVVYCGYNKIDKNNIIKPEKTNFKEENILTYFFDKNGFFHFSGILVKKFFLIKNNIRFDTAKKIQEDILFTIELLIKSKAYCVNENLFNYHYRSNSVTNSCWNANKYLHDIKSFNHIITFVYNNYKNKNCNKVISLMINEKRSKEMNYLIYCLNNFKYKNIKIYIEENSLSNLINNENKINKSEKRKMDFIKSNSYFLFFIGTIYYRYIRGIF